jgi:hypothetical protein
VDAVPCAGGLRILFKPIDFKRLEVLVEKLTNTGR